MKTYCIEWTADLFGNSTVEADSEEQAVAKLREQYPAIQAGKWIVEQDWEISDIDISEIEEVADPPEPPSDDHPARSGLDEAGVFDELTPEQALQCLYTLPPEWRSQISSLAEGQTFERMGRAWFYGSPHDEEDCFWKAAVQNGILHVEFEVGCETCRRRFDIPVTAFAGEGDAATTMPAQGKEG